MNCTTHVLGTQWRHHSWRRLVTDTALESTPGTDMWGRSVEDERVWCRTLEICDGCGQVRHVADCYCNTDKGEHCGPRCTFLNASHQRGKSSR